ncbi:MAG: hypothetical protein KAR23_06440, partial [Candidatus Aenigmarchaeota archaeon]|nr:hypothetical protein [Candidatus Aenigmarchaeota archaeon]
MTSLDDNLTIMLDEVSSKMKQKKEYLLEKGYSYHYPFAEWNVMIDSLIMHYAETETRQIPSNELDKILDSSIKVSDDDCEIIRDWYKLSAYRFGHKCFIIDKKITDAQEKNDFNEAKRLKAKMESLKLESNTTSTEERIKKQLAHQYNESSKERIEELYNIIYKDDDEKVDIGCFRVYVSDMNCKQELENAAYEKSKGFFEDIEYVYRIIKDLKSEIKETSEPGLLYASLDVFAGCSANLELYNKNIELTAQIKRNDLDDIFGLDIFAGPFSFDIPELLDKLKLTIPSCTI